MASSKMWGNLPLESLTGSCKGPNNDAFPKIRPSYDHTVLFQIPTPQHGPPTSHDGGEDKWDDYHVKMPYSSHNKYDRKVFGQKSRWGEIEDALKKKISKGVELHHAILKYNGKFKNEWHFTALLEYLTEYGGKHGNIFKLLLPKMQKLALDLPNLIKAPLPLLRRGDNKSVSLSQQQIASLLANAFFCTFPQRNTRTEGSAYATYSKINFCSLFNTPPSPAIFHKLDCIFNYFRRVCDQPPTGVVTFSRRSVPPSDLPKWSLSSDLPNMPVTVDDMTLIENATGLIQVDFANKFIGGGVLGRGQLQEEIRFLICPELMAGMLFVESLGDLEALMIIGVERYSNYSGYGQSFEYQGDYFDLTPHDRSGRKACALLAIDATHYHCSDHQFQRHQITRELNKAFVGFSFFSDPTQSLSFPGVATGNWGCGAFNGDPLLKALIQLMACAVARRPMAYLTFGDRRLTEQVLQLFRMLLKHNITVGILYNKLPSRNIKNAEDLKRSLNYFESILENAEAYPQELMEVDNENQGQYPTYGDHGYSTSGRGGRGSDRYHNRMAGSSGRSINKNGQITINNERSDGTAFTSHDLIDLSSSDNSDNIQHYDNKCPTASNFSMRPTHTFQESTLPEIKRQDDSGHRQTAQYGTGRIASSSFEHKLDRQDAGTSENHDGRRQTEQSGTERATSSSYELKLDRQDTGNSNYRSGRIQTRQSVTESSPISSSGSKRDYLHASTSDNRSDHKQTGQSVTESSPFSSSGSKRDYQDAGTSDYRSDHRQTRQSFTESSASEHKLHSQHGQKSANKHENADIGPVGPKTFAAAVLARRGNPNQTSSSWVPSGKMSFETSSSTIGSHSNNKPKPSVSVKKRERGRGRKRS